MVLRPLPNERHTSSRLHSIESILCTTPTEHDKGQPRHADHEGEDMKGWRLCLEYPEREGTGCDEVSLQACGRKYGKATFLRPLLHGTFEENNNPQFSAPSPTSPSSSRPVAIQGSLLILLPLDQHFRMTHIIAKLLHPHEHSGTSGHQCRFLYFTVSKRRL